MKRSNSKILKMTDGAKKNRKRLTHITDKSKLSTHDIVKLALCRHFVQFSVSKRMSLTQISKMIGVPLTRLSEMTNYKIQKFTVDQLLKNLSLLAEHDDLIKEYLIFVGIAAELPTLPIARTRKLSKDIIEASTQV